VAILLSVAIALFLSAGPLTGTAAAVATQQSPPTITHNAWVGQTLHLTPGTYSDATPSAEQWVMCSDSAGLSCNPPTADTSDTYLIGNGDVGSYLKVTETVTGTDSSVTPFDSNVTFQVADSILALSYLGFLGFGLQYPTASWGDMLGNAQNAVQSGYWWLVYPVGGCLVVVVLACNVIGDALRDAFDVRLRRR